jgi:hypothetical protein
LGKPSDHTRIYRILTEWELGASILRSRKVSIGMGNKNMNLSNIVRAALALGVLGALGLASGADWFFGSCFSWLF